MIGLALAQVGIKVSLVHTLDDGVIATRTSLEHGVVRDQTERKNPDTRVSGNDDFRYGRHPHHVSSKCAQHAALGTCFVTVVGHTISQLNRTISRCRFHTMQETHRLPGTSDERVDTLVQLSLALVEAQFLPSLVHSLAQLEIVRVGEWREARAELVSIGSAQRVKSSKSSEVQMLLWFGGFVSRTMLSPLMLVACKEWLAYIVQAHDITNSILRVQAARGVGDYVINVSQSYSLTTLKRPNYDTRRRRRTNHCFHADNFAHARGKRDQVHGVTLIKMSAANKQHDRQLGRPNETED